jgi:vancomycin permeability regulator SanA
VRFIRRHPLVVGCALVVLAALGVLVGTGFAVWNAAHVDEARRVDHADLIAVLGAAEYSGRPSPVFTGRLEHAEQMYRQGFAEEVLVLGGNRPGDVTTEAAAGRAWLVDKGLPESAVFADPIGNDTLESVRGVATFMRDHHLSTVFLVSDPWHNLRIRRMARDLGVRAFVSATWHSAARSQWTRLSGYSRETFAYLSYRIRGR